MHHQRKKEARSYIGVSSFPLQLAPWGASGSVDPLHGIIPRVRCGDQGWKGRRQLSTPPSRSSQNKAGHCSLFLHQPCGDSSGHGGSLQPKIPGRIWGSKGAGGIHLPTPSPNYDQGHMSVCHPPSSVDASWSFGAQLQLYQYVGCLPLQKTNPK